jgi:hypothetical protein
MAMLQHLALGSHQTIVSSLYVHPLITPIRSCALQRPCLLWTTPPSPNSKAPYYNFAFSPTSPTFNFGLYFFRTLSL